MAGLLWALGNFFQAETSPREFFEFLALWLLSSCQTAAVVRGGSAAWTAFEAQKCL